MNQLDVMSYRKVNEAIRRRMVYHVGVDCGLFVEMNYMVDAMLYCLARLSIPALYDGIHIRGGDKNKETELISGQRIMKTLNPKDGSCVFILTDDYRQFLKLQADYPQLRLVTLCQADETGYRHLEFCKLSPQKRKESIIRLLISVDLLLHSRAFVGSITTGPSVFVMKQRADNPFVQAVDCPKASLSSSLPLTIDRRAAISKKSLKEHEFSS